MMKPSAQTFGQFYQKGTSDLVRSISMTSCTIPGQARDLGALLAASRYQGGMIPRHGTPVYDEDLAHGIARLQVEQMDDEQLSDIAIRAGEETDKKDELAKDAEKVEDPKDDGV